MLLDILRCVPMMIIILIVNYTRPRPVQRGFFCDDVSIRYPYRHETITLNQLVLIMLLVAFFMIFLVEFITRWLRRFAFNKSWPWWLHSIFTTVKVYCAFAFGFEMTQMVMFTCKYPIGRLRPHFIDVCQPDFSRINCSMGYIQDFECSETSDPALTYEARLSFLSGHSAFAVYFAIYISYYLERRLWFMNKRVHLLKMFIQLSFVCFGLWVSLTRISDNLHHPSDVIAGAIVGLLIGIGMVYVTEKSVDHAVRVAAAAPAAATGEVVGVSSKHAFDVLDEIIVGSRGDVFGLKYYGSHAQVSASAFSSFVNQSASEKTKLLIH